MRADTIQIKILVDNEAKEDLLAEHGFSLWLQVNDQQLLFDTGQNDALVYNANKLDVHLDQADILVLSHGHYDHTGGLFDVLSCNHKVKVYCHAAAFLPRYSIKDGTARPVKMTPKAMASIGNLPENRMQWVTKPANISEHFAITGEIPRNNDFETSGGPFYFDQDGKRTDVIIDDMALWVKSKEGLIVCIGCCHAGIINTLQHIKKVSGIDKIHTLIGGLHLMNATEERLARTIDFLKHENIEQIITCHCTGDDAHAMLQQRLGSQKGFAGMELHFQSLNRKRLSHFDSASSFTK